MVPATAPEAPVVPTRPNSPSTLQSSASVAPVLASSVASSLYSLIGFPGVLPPNASRSALITHNLELAEYAVQCKDQMAADHASKKLMDAENGRLREQLFAKKNKPAKHRVGGAGARHMTSEETLRQLAFIDWKAAIAIMHAEFQLDDRVKAAKALYDGAWKEMMDGWKRVEKDALDAQKAIERDERRAEAEAEKAEKKAEADAERALKKAAADAEKAVKKAALDVEKAEKKAAAEAERARKKGEAEKEKERKALERERKREEKVAAAAAAPKKRGTKRKADDTTHLDNDENVPPPGYAYTPDTPPAQKRPRPTPRPIYSGAALLSGETAHAESSAAVFAPRLELLAPVLPHFEMVIDPSLL
ncbi:hypothetical protein B0H11DRAFT_1975863 [Mycena galericulata]|nr:hypothetical protein B0H11DRAFT_1975863 [Mycena galericulata]